MNNRVEYTVSGNGRHFYEWRYSLNTLVFDINTEDALTCSAVSK